VTYSLRSSAGKTGIQVGGTNLLDQAPASIYSNSTYMSAPSTYDFRGRFLYARVSQSF
jgi:outer membrane receptor protein involved in Fe transport